MECGHWETVIWVNVVRWKWRIAEKQVFFVQNASIDRLKLLMGFH